MCNHYDRSILQILQVFQCDVPKTINVAVSELGDEVFSLNLYCRPLDEFISSLAWADGYLTECADGYVLNDKGKKEQSELELQCL